MRSKNIRFYNKLATDIENGSYYSYSGREHFMEFKDYARTTWFGEPLEEETILRAGDNPVIVMSNNTRQLLPNLDPFTTTGKLIVTGTGSALEQEGFFYGIEVWDGDTLVERFSYSNEERIFEIELKKTTYTLWTVCETDPFIPSPGRTIGAIVTQVRRYFEYKICGQTYEASPLNTEVLEGRKLTYIERGEVVYEYVGLFEVFENIAFTEGQVIKFSIKTDDISGSDGFFIEKTNSPTLSLSFPLLTLDYVEYAVVIPATGTYTFYIDGTRGPITIKDLAFLDATETESTYQDETPYGFAWELSTLDHSTDAGLYSFEVGNYVSEPISVVTQTEFKLFKFWNNGWRNCAVKGYNYELWLPIDIQATPKSEGAVATQQNRNVLISSFDEFARKISVTEPQPKYYTDIFEGIWNFNNVEVDSNVYTKMEGEEPDIARVDEQTQLYDMSVAVRLPDECQDFGEDEFRCADADYVIINQDEVVLTSGTISSGTAKIIEVNTEALPCADATLTLNGDSFLTVASGSTTDIELVSQSDTPIVPTSVVGNKITIEVPEKLIFLEYEFKDGEDEIIGVVRANRVGAVITSITSSGVIGTLISSVNGGAITLPHTLLLSDEFEFIRSNTGGEGYVELSGYYV